MLPQSIRIRHSVLVRYWAGQGCEIYPRRPQMEKNTNAPITLTAKKWGDTEIAERGRSMLVMRARYTSAELTPHQRGWTDAG